MYAEVCHLSSPIAVHDDILVTLLYITAKRKTILTTLRLFRFDLCCFFVHTIPLSFLLKLMQYISSFLIDLGASKVHGLPWFASIHIFAFCFYCALSYTFPGLSCYLPRNAPVISRRFNSSLFPYPLYIFQRKVYTTYLILWFRINKLPGSVFSCIKNIFGSFSQPYGVLLFPFDVFFLLIVRLSTAPTQVLPPPILLTPHQKWMPIPRNLKIFRISSCFALTTVLWLYSTFPIR